jgi:hypothetical protein
VDEEMLERNNWEEGRGTGRGGQRRGGGGRRRDQTVLFFKFSFSNQNLRLTIITKKKAQEKFFK